MKKPLNNLNISTEYLKKISRMNLSAEQRNKIKPQKIFKKNSESHKIMENKKILNLNYKENYSNLNNKLLIFLCDENKKFNFNFNYNRYVKILNNINKEMLILIESNIKNNLIQKTIKDELNKKIELISNYLNSLFLNLEKYQNDILSNLKIKLNFYNNENEKNNFFQNEKITFYINNLSKLIKNYKINQKNLNDNLINSLNKLNVNLNLNNFNKNLDLFYNNSKNIFKNLKDIQTSNLNININNNKLNFTHSEIINNNNNNENIIKKINLKNSYSTKFMKKNINNNNFYNLNNNNNNKLNKSISKEKLKTLSKIHNSFSNLFEHNYIITNPNELEYEKNNNTNLNSKNNFNFNEYISTNKNSNEIFNLKNSFYSNSITEENTQSNNNSNYNYNNKNNQINFISQKIIDFLNIMKNLQNFIIKKDSNNVSKLKKEFEISKKNLEILARNILMKKKNNININNNNKNIIIIDDLEKNNNNNNIFNNDLNKLKKENETLKNEIKKINEKNKKNNFNGISQIKLREFENIIKNQREKIDSLQKEKIEINKELKNYINLNKDCNSLLIQIKKIIFEKNLILNNETLNNIQNLFNNNKNIFDDSITLNNINSEISNGLPNNSIEEENKKLKKLFEECINIINNSIKENSDFLINNNNNSDSEYSQKILLTENTESEENSIDNIIKNSLFNFNIKNNDSNEEILENTIKKNNSIDIDNIKSAVKLFSTYNNEINNCIKKLKDENSKIKNVNKELTEELNSLSINNVEEKEFKIDFNSNTEIFTLKSLEIGKNKKPINFTESQKNKYLQKEIIRLKSIIEQLKINQNKDKKVDINITIINALTNLLNEINLTNKIKEYFDIIFKLLGLNEENINKIYNNRKNKHKSGIY